MSGQTPSSQSIASALESSKDERDKTLVIRQVTPDITTFSTPFVCSHLPYSLFPRHALSFHQRPELSSTPIWSLANASMSQTRAGAFAIGGRSTAIRLPTSEVFLYVSTPHTPATAQTIGQVGGEVKWLVTPDGEHAMFIEEFTKAYPNAQYVVFPPSILLL